MFRCLVECLELSGRRLPLFRLTRSSLQFLADPNHPSSLRFPVFMGGFKHLSRRSDDEGAPLLVIKGLAVMGGVDIKVKK